MRCRLFFLIFCDAPRFERCVCFFLVFRIAAGGQMPRFFFFRKRPGFVVNASGCLFSSFFTCKIVPLRGGVYSHYYGNYLSPNCSSLKGANANRFTPVFLLLIYLSPWCRTYVLFIVLLIVLVLLIVPSSLFPQNVSRAVVNSSQQYLGSSQRVVPPAFASAQVVSTVVLASKSWYIYMNI